jgi:tetratricopeptide (TPR) repeat protein
MMAPMQVRAICDSIARWSLVALIALMPFFVVPASWVTVVQSKLLLGGILLGIVVIFYCLARFAQGMVLIPRDPILYAALLLPLCYLISAYFSHSPASSYASGLAVQDTVASMALLFASLTLTAVLFAGGARNVLLVFLAFLGSISLVVLFQVIRLITPTWFSLGGALTGSASTIVGSWHDLGIIVGLLVFFSVALFNSQFLGKTISTIALPVIGCVSFGLLFIIGLTDIWYALGVLLLVFALYLGLVARLRDAHDRTKLMPKALVAFFIGAVALIIGYAGNIIYPHLPSSLRIEQTEVRPSWVGTFAIGEKVFTSSGSFFGTGPNAFQNAWGKFKPTNVNQTAFWSTDFTLGVGIVPTSFVTAGPIGILAWVLFFLAIIFHIIRFLRAPSPDRVLHASLVGSVLFLVAFHIFYTPTLSVSLILFFLLGLSVALVTHDHSRVFALSLSLARARGIFALVLLLLFGSSVLLAAGATVRAAVSDVIIQKAATDYNASGDVERALSLVNVALRVDSKNDGAHRAAVELGLQQLQKLLASGNSADANALKTALSNTIASGLSAVSIDSNDYQNWLSLAGAYQNLASVGVEGAYENAIIAYQKAAAANPTNPLPLIGAAQVTLAKGDATSTLGYLNAAILLKSDLAVAYFLRSQAEGLMGNYAPAIQDGKNAISLAQQDPLGWYNLGTLLYLSGDYQSAAQVLSQAVSLNNTYSNALFMLSLTFNKLHDNQNAILAMQKVVELNPQNATASSTLASLIAASSTSHSTKKTKAR